MSAPPTAWPIVPRLICSRPWEPEFTNVEAKEGSLAWTTRSPPRLLEPEGPSEPSVSSKCETESPMFRAWSGSREIGGISKSSSPRLGVWKVCHRLRKNRMSTYLCVLNWVKTLLLSETTHRSGQERMVALSADAEITVVALWKLKRHVNNHGTNNQRSLRRFILIKDDWMFNLTLFSSE